MFLLLLICASDIELNPWPRKNNISYNFSFYYWNLNSIAAHNFSKLSLLEACNVQHKFDMICLSETFLDSSIPTNDEKLNMKGYKLIRADKPRYGKKGGVGIYYKEFLAVFPVEVKNLNECVIFEVSIKNKRGYVVSLYRSPSQTQDEFDIFLVSFEQLNGDIIAKNPLFVLIAGDFNVRSTNWWENDLSTSEGTQVDSLTTSYGLSQIISDPTHILPNSSSCIDLIFTNQPNLVTESGVHPSLHPKCHHQIVFTKLNLKVEYPPLYERFIWDYKNADIPSINRAIDIFDWVNSLEGKNAHEQVHFFNKTIFHNYIPNKTILCNDKDPRWFNNEIRKILTMKNEIFKQYIANGKSQTDYKRLQLISNSLTETIRSSKEKFYCKLSTKLANRSTSSKTYWSILKIFVNGKKILIIPPLLLNDNFITNFLEKANLFNEFFSKQCQPLQNNSTLPKSNMYHTENRLNNITFDNEKLLKIIQSLDANKAHGYDGISVRMLKLSSPSIIKPPSIIFQNCLKSSTFPDDWKKGNIVLVHKKNNKQLVNNYRPVSLLPICSKISGNVIFDSIFNFVIQNNLLNSC